MKRHFVSFSFTYSIKTLLSVTIIVSMFDRIEDFYVSLNISFQPLHSSFVLLTHQSSWTPQPKSTSSPFTPFLHLFQPFPAVSNPLQSLSFFQYTHSSSICYFKPHSRVRKSTHVSVHPFILPIQPSYLLQHPCHSYSIHLPLPASMYLTTILELFSAFLHHSYSCHVLSQPPQGPPHSPTFSNTTQRSSNST